MPVHVVSFTLIVYFFLSFFVAWCQTDPFQHASQCLCNLSLVLVVQTKQIASAPVMMTAVAAASVCLLLVDLRRRSAGRFTVGRKEGRGKGLKTRGEIPNVEKPGHLALPCFKAPSVNGRGLSNEWQRLKAHYHSLQLQKPLTKM